jgi:hypothetical protein
LDLQLGPAPALGHAQLPQHERERHASNEAKVSSIKRDSTRVAAASSCPEPCLEPPCENFLYVFKAARRAARAAATARSPSLPLALPLRRRQRRSSGAKVPGCRAAIERTAVTGSSAAGCPCSRCEIVRGRAEPVKSAYGVGSADLRLLTDLPAQGSGSDRDHGREWPGRLTLNGNVGRLQRPPPELRIQRSGCRL